jgi:hypothetical protein
MSRNTRSAKSTAEITTYTPTAETKRQTAVIEEATVILNRAFASDPKDNSQQANIGRSHLNCFALNLDSQVRDNLEPQYDEAIVEMTRWLEGDEAAEGEKQGQVEELALQDTKF